MFDVFKLICKFVELFVREVFLPRRKIIVSSRAAWFFVHAYEALKHSRERLGMSSADFLFGPRQPECSPLFRGPRGVLRDQNVGAYCARFAFIFRTVGTYAAPPASSLIVLPECAEQLGSASEAGGVPLSGFVRNLGTVSA